MTTATAAQAPQPIEAPRDQPNALADRKALGLVKPYQGMVAWHTVFVAMAIVAGFALVTTLATMRIIPLWLGLILNSWILYMDQTPLHEACHGNIAGRDSRYLWLNHLVGTICGALLLHEYKAFRHMHLAHHRDTNNPDIDPDHWVSVKGPFNVLFRCFTIVFWYHHYFWKYIFFRPDVPGNRALAIHIIAVYTVLYSIAFWLSVFGWWREVFMLWIIPHFIASAMIIYFFAYLTHKPHEAKERYRDTNVFWFKGKLAEPLVNGLYMFQNFHLIHHLFPRIPFYLYPKAFRDLKPVLEQERARIFEFGH